MSHSQADTLASRSRQASSGSFRLPRCALRGRVGFRPTSEFGVRHGHPPLHGVVFFTDQVLSQIDLLRYWMETTAYRNAVHLLPKELDEKVGMLCSGIGTKTRPSRPMSTSYQDSSTIDSAGSEGLNSMKVDNGRLGQLRGLERHESRQRSTWPAQRA